MPIYLQSAFGALFPTAPTTSDLVPSIADGAGLVRLGALLMITAGLLALAAAFHPRRDGGSRSRRIALGAALLAVASVMVGGIAWRSVGLIDRRAALLEAHRARSQDVAPDVRAITGTVRIDPGRQLQLDLRLQVRAPADRRLETLLFTFNPGLTDRTRVVGRRRCDLDARRWPAGDQARERAGSGCRDLGHSRRVRQRRTPLRATSTPPSISSAAMC